MADNQPINENTQAQQQQTESLRELQQELQHDLAPLAQAVPPALAQLAQSGGHAQHPTMGWMPVTANNLPELVRAFAAQQQQQNKPQTQSLVKPLISGPPPVPPSGSTPPPVPPSGSTPASGPAIAGAVAELNRRLEALADVYRRGAGPQDIAARGLRARVREQESFLGQQYAGLSESEQKRGQPQMQAMEAKRAEVLETEMRLRERMNKDLTGGTRTLQGFLAALGQGTPLAAIQQGAVVGGTIATAKRLIQEEGVREERGARTAFPGLGQTVDVSKRREELAESIRGRGVQALDEEAKMRQARTALLNAKQLAPSEDPDKITGIKGMPMAAESLWNRLRAAAANPGSAAAAWAEAGAKTHREYYEKLASERGVKIDYKKDFVLPPELRPQMQGGITTGLQYQTELQIGTLQREDETNRLLQEVIDLMGGEWLNKLDQVKNGLENLNPWGD